MGASRPGLSAPVDTSPFCWLVGRRPGAGGRAGRAQPGARRPRPAARPAHGALALGEGCRCRCYQLAADMALGQLSMDCARAHAAFPCCPSPYFLPSPAQPVGTHVRFDDDDEAVASPRQKVYLRGLPQPEGEQPRRALGGRASAPTRACQAMHMPPSPCAAASNCGPPPPLRCRHPHPLRLVWRESGGLHGFLAVRSGAARAPVTCAR